LSEIVFLCTKLPDYQSKSSVTDMHTLCCYLGCNNYISIFKPTEFLFLNQIMLKLLWIFSLFLVLWWKILLCKFALCGLI